MKLQKYSRVLRDTSFKIPLTEQEELPKVLVKMLVDKKYEFQN